MERGRIVETRPLQALESGRISQTKTYFILVLVSPDVKSGTAVSMDG